MLSKEKDRIRHYWNGRAESYNTDTGHGFHSAQDQGLWSRVITRNLRQDHGNEALDLGTGPGYLAILLSQLGYQSTGLDISEEMLRAAETKAKDLGLSIDFRKGDVESPPFNTNSMDLIVCRHIMWTLFDLRKVVATWKDILKENGQLIIIDGIWYPDSLQGLLCRTAGHMIRLFKQRKVPINWKKNYIEDQRMLPYISGAPPEVVLETLKAAGFKHIKHDPLKDVLDFERRHAPLDYRIMFTHNPRYLITGVK